MVSAGQKIAPYAAEEESVTSGRQSYFSTKLTSLLGIRHPILCGGLMWLSDGAYVSAVANAGAMGFITPRSFSSPDAFRDALKDCTLQANGQPFGVNLYVSSRREENEKLLRFAEVAIEEHVRVFETAGRSPVAFLPMLKEANAKVIHKVTTIKHAIKAESIGVDAVVILGGECGGHPGVNKLPAMLLAALARPKLKIPLIVGGGIGSGAQLLAALSLGADGILMGSRMLVASEIWAHNHYKEHIVEINENGTRRILENMGNAYQCLNNDTAQTISALEAAGHNDYETLGPYIGGHLQKSAYKTGDFNKGVLSLGPAAAFADKIEPVEKIIQRILHDAMEAYGDLSQKIIFQNEMEAGVHAQASC